MSVVTLDRDVAVTVGTVTVSSCMGAVAVTNVSWSGMVKQLQALEMRIASYEEVTRSERAVFGAARRWLASIVKVLVTTMVLCVTIVLT